MENFQSPPSIDLHVGMFVIPRRKNLSDLCPIYRLPTESITNAFAADSSSIM